MVNSILQTMQAIETEAQQILADYDQQIQVLREASVEELETIRKECDSQTQSEVTGLEKALKEDNQRLKEELAETITANESSVRSVLTDNKEALVQQIIDRVVEAYGN